MKNQQLAPIIIGKLLNIGGMLQRNGNRLLLPYGLNQQQFSVFFEITQAGQIKQKDMVNRLLLEKAHVSKIVKKLLNLGLINISVTDEDKRSYWLSPTTKGKKVLEKILKVIEQWNREWTAEFDEKQLNSTIESLASLQAVFKEKIR